tara:strand:- start:154 stop:798 length:645 start_codon:yes stop_codon:yes gene_type:complete
MNSHKIILIFLFIINASYAEEIYKVEVIFIRFNDVVTDEKFIKNLNFTPKSIEELKENEIELIPQKFIDNVLSSVDLLDLDINEIQIIADEEVNTSITEAYNLYKYENLENLDFLTGRLRWRDNIEILDSISWYQPVKSKNEYTFHFSDKNNISFYLNLYQSRYLHLNLKAFFGKHDLDKEIKEFIDEDRRVKNSEINYFDHPSMGVIVKIDKT